MNSVKCQSHHFRFPPRLLRVRHRGSRLHSTAVYASLQTNKIEISYNTAWQSPLLYFSADGHVEWNTKTLKSRPSAGDWKFATIEAENLSFVLTDGQDHWDKAPEGENYTISRPGRFILKDGHLQQVAIPGVLLFSDLDDTMIGNDESTLAFKHWWHNEGAAAGGRLVYNTGRALDLFQELMDSKKGILPECDALISSVGTKIYINNRGKWEEDSEYAESLTNNGWNLEAAREACYAAIFSIGKDEMHFRPPSEMNEHKVTCGVHASKLKQATDQITKALVDSNVRHKIIVSGKGDWRFMDLLPENAGKKAALEYIRGKLGYEVQHTVACGDSGNDLDMLVGEWHGIVVGNAQPDLLEWIQQQPEESRRNILMVHRERAYGILEGLETLRFKR